MSLLPYLLEEFSRPNMYDQHYSTGIFDDNTLIPYNTLYHTIPSLTRRYPRPWRLVAAPQSGLSHIQNDKNSFKVNLDVQQFKPEEVNVKVANGFVVVEGKHEERSDEHGYISRQFTRRYKLPENVDPNMVTSKLSSDGVLSVGAPKKAIENKKDERSIPVVQTNQPSVKVSDKKEKNGVEKMET
ncbi:alpha-crystallin A chain-like [Daktulosphaira vitifoliae]|uniref:alpha-crystallin A chain-like n=1 Tax=Daktulosphaira vitifoliae TaxID=58002 RepID=UPI0021A99A7C|nr:alpha-crystallin A chain-like [Daktulosphaira vitifoliae]